MLAGFSSCSKDDDDDFKGESYLEIAVNGKTYKETSIISMQAGGITSLYIQTIGQIETSDADISVDLWFYKNEKDFKTATTGEYRINEYDKNFDLIVDLTTSGGNGYYRYNSGGKHRVTNIKLLNTDKNSGILTYLLEGTLSCSFNHTQNGKTIELSGKYWVKLYVDAESKS
jgi:hypothetical protein